MLKISIISFPPTGILYPRLRLSFAFLVKMELVLYPALKKCMLSASSSALSISDCGHTTINSKLNIKSKTRNPNHQLFTNRPNVEKFASDLRESRDEMKKHIFNKYINILTINRLIEYVPMCPAFKRGSSWMKSMHLRRVNLRHG